MSDLHAHRPIAGDLARLPHRMTYEEEFLFLMDQRKRIDGRLSELVDALDRAPGKPGLKLPKSGLSIVAVADPSLDKGGRRNG